MNIVYRGFIHKLVDGEFGFHMHQAQVYPNLSINELYEKFGRWMGNEEDKRDNTVYS